MKIVLAGSPDIAVPAFEKVINNFEVVAIITQPDKAQGRGLKIQETAVAKLAAKYQIPVFKPLRVGHIYEDLKDLNFDLLLTFAFGQYIPSKILNLGQKKPLNIHGSLLPKYRGSAPIHHAILNGDSEIGITLMEMIQEMDAGDMFFKASQPITSDTTTGEGFEIVSHLASENIVQWLEKIEKNDVHPEPQGHNFTLAPKIENDFAELKLQLVIDQAQKKINGLSPFPGAFIYLNEKRLKVFKTSSEFQHQAIPLSFQNGTLYAIDYQWESKKRIVLPSNLNK